MYCRLVFDDKVEVVVAVPFGDEWRRSGGGGAGRAPPVGVATSGGVHKNRFLKNKSGH